MSLAALERLDTRRRRRLLEAIPVARQNAIDGARDVTVSEVLARAARRRRYELRDTMQHLTARDRLKGCGRKRVTPEVQVKLGTRGAGYAGLSYCESIWSCPTCSAVIRSQRADEIQRAVASHITGGGGALFITMTLPHGKKDPLRGLLKQVTQGWGKIMNRRSGRDWRDRLGLLGYIRAVEVTHGANGWHPHLHLLVLTETPVLSDTRAAFGAWLTSQWVTYTSDRAWKATGGKWGVDVQDVTGSDGVTKYVAKVQDACGSDRVLGSEISRADLKTGRGRHGKTPFELLSDVTEYRADATLVPDGRHERRIGALWREYEEETAGLSALRWSPGLRDRLDVPEISDAELLASVDLGDDVQTVMRIPAADWHVLVVSGQRGRLLDVVETIGPDAARTFVQDTVLAYLQDWAAAVELAFEDPPD